jgi:TetR/AcrR family transcriptional repressor of nem operon
MKPESSSKQKLLQTAMEMIWQSSYGSVSVDDICTQAGVNKGSFYYAFK